MRQLSLSLSRSCSLSLSRSLSFYLARAYLRLLHRPVVLISSLNLSREALVDLAQPVRQDAQVLLDLGFLFFLLQYLAVHLSKSQADTRRDGTGREGTGFTQYHSVTKGGKPPVSRGGHPDQGFGRL